MKRLFLAISAGLALSLSAAPASALIVGDTVSGTIGTIFGDWNLSPSSTTVVTGGPDFVISISGGRGINIDIEEGVIIYQYNNVSSIAIGSCNLNCFLTISDIDDTITGVSIVETNAGGGGGFGGNSAAFTDHSITLFFDGTWDSLDNVVLTFASVAAVPAPGALALLAAGLLGLGFARRHRPI